MTGRSDQREDALHTWRDGRCAIDGEIVDPFQQQHDIGMIGCDLVVQTCQRGRILGVLAETPGVDDENAGGRERRRIVRAEGIEP
jgi:hypothetical protein